MFFFIYSFHASSFTYCNVTSQTPLVLCFNCFISPLFYCVSYFKTAPLSSSWDLLLFFSLSCPFIYVPIPLSLLTFPLPTFLCLFCSSPYSLSSRSLSLRPFSLPILPQPKQQATGERISS